jgi:hypothetical protein
MHSAAPVSTINRMPRNCLCVLPMSHVFASCLLFHQTFIADLPNSNRCFSEIDIDNKNMFKVNSKGRLQHINANSDGDCMNVKLFPWKFHERTHALSGGKSSRDYDGELKQGVSYRIWDFNPMQEKSVGSLKEQNRRKVPQIASHFILVPDTCTSMSSNEIENHAVRMMNVDVISSNDVVGTFTSLVVAV